ncbi:MAG: bifunctional nicotinamidase/pyrazinamidase [Promethearchaeota archaeon]|nr:MAG: bifunctional nicotinamidase/pyrazinamidase [Candidatus Lokiarchaeota archaeon]
MNKSNLNYEKNIEISKQDALLIVDMQYDFMPGGALAVEEGDQIIEGINTIAQKFHNNLAKIVLTQDWHPKNHLSFASNHPGKEPGDEYQTDTIGPILWPDHCVPGTKGAKFHEDLQTNLAHAVIRKGYNPKIDSYSGFLENDKKSETGLAGLLKSLKVRKIFICGLALDYCCFWTAMDGLDFGFEVYLLADLTKGIDDPPGNIAKSLKTMSKKGVKFANVNSFK